MPNVFVSAFERAKPYTDSEQSLTAPSHAGNDNRVSNGLCFTAVNSYLKFFVYAGFEEFFKSVVVLVLIKINVICLENENRRRVKKRLLVSRNYQSGVSYSNDKVKERLESCFLTRRSILDLE